MPDNLERTLMKMHLAVIPCVAVGVFTCVAELHGGSPIVGTAGPDSTLHAPGLKPDERIQVLVLASPHLNQQIPADALRDGLNELLDALGRYQPDLIAVESLPGDLIESYERLTPTYDEVLQAFASELLAAGKAARQTARLDRRGASERVEVLLASFEGKRGNSISSAERKQAALLLAAAYDLPSAAMQWSYLPAEQRVASGEVPSEVAEALTRTLASQNEVTAVGIALGARMKLERLHGVDDQSDALFQLRSGEKMMNELSQSPELAKLKESMLMKELPKRIQKHIAEGDFLGLYRWMNTSAYASADVDAQWHIFHRTRLASGLDRRRAGLWEVRNLRIAANIRAATAEAKAKRALVIIGASHKPFLDAYLGAMMDIAVVDAESVLAR